MSVNSSPSDSPSPTTSLLRAGPILALLALLFTWSWATETGRVGYRGILEAEAGSHHVLSLFTVTEVREDGYRASRGHLGFDIVANPEGLVVGEDISAGITVEASGEITEEWRVKAPGRDAKKRLGVVGLVLAGGIALLTLRISPKGILIRG